jgi:hypothetical protein
MFMILPSLASRPFRASRLAACAGVVGTDVNNTLPPASVEAAGQRDTAL